MNQRHSSNNIGSRRRRQPVIVPLDGRFIVMGTSSRDSSSDDEINSRRVRQRISESVHPNISNNEPNIEHEGNNRIVLSLQPYSNYQNYSEESNARAPTTRIVLDIQDTSNTNELLGTVVDRLIDQWLGESRSSSDYDAGLEDDFSDSILEDYDIDESNSDHESIISISSNADTWNSQISSDEDFSFNTKLMDKEGALLDHFYELFDRDFDVRHCHKQLQEFDIWFKKELSMDHPIDFSDSFENQYYSSNGYGEGQMHKNDFIVGVASQEPGMYFFMNDDITRQYMKKLGQSYQYYHSIGTQPSYAKCIPPMSCHDYFGDDFCSDDEFDADSIDSLVSIPGGSFTSYFKRIISFAHISLCRSWKKQRQELYDYIDDPEIDSSSPICTFISSLCNKDTYMCPNLPRRISKGESSLDTEVSSDNDSSLCLKRFEQHRHLHLYRALDMNLVYKHIQVVIERLRDPPSHTNVPTKSCINTSISLTTRSPHSSSFTSLPSIDYFPTTKLAKPKPISHTHLLSCLLYTIRYYEYVYCMFESQITLCESYLDGSLFNTGPYINSITLHESSIILIGSIARHMRRISNQCIILKHYIDMLTKFINEYLATGYALDPEESKEHVPFIRYNSCPDELIIR